MTAINEYAKNNHEKSSHAPATLY